ncbi:hypothetical protein AZE42_09145 [Rhizopogon vesiculosus]|uniref:Uncharacterized protein n=1 Tax=Rhizopogon vesiculosus TaxID=180088 RepID=A0A1J8Q279_9AGAM|nr:hypothetical protein AZE42_09145 [Rhizopogon vesiculosus]
MSRSQPPVRDVVF